MSLKVEAKAGKPGGKLGVMSHNGKFFKSIFLLRYAAGFSGFLCWQVINQIGRMLVSSCTVLWTDVENYGTMNERGSGRGRSRVLKRNGAGKVIVAYQRFCCRYEKPREHDCNGRRQGGRR